MIYQIKNGTVVEFDKNYIEFLYEKYVPPSSLIVQPYDAIPSGFKHVILDGSNPIDIDKVLNTNATTILTGNYHYYKTLINPKIKFFPFWAVWMSSPYGPLANTTNHHFSNQPKKYPVSCLNGTQWQHRKLTYLELYKKSYFSNMVFSFVQRPGYATQPYEIQLTDQEHNQFSQLPQLVEFLADDKNIGIDLSINHPAYRESYINLVTETTVNESTPMLSEKTFKPIVAGQLFILIATTGAVQFLRDIGIDTFDDIIDHSYDSVVDVRTRIQMALIQVDRLVSKPLDQLYDQIKPRLIKNSEYFRSQAFRNQFLVKFN